MTPRTVRSQVRLSLTTFEDAADDGQDEGVDDDAVVRDPDELAGGGVRLDVGFVDVEGQEGGDGDQFGGGGADHRHEQEEKHERCPTGPEEGDGCGGRGESGAVLFRGQSVGISREILGVGESGTAKPHGGGETKGYAIPCQTP